MRRLLPLLAFVLATTPSLAQQPVSPVKEVVLFDFESPGDAKEWTNLTLPAAKAQEPAATVELSPENATRGAQSLKIRFAGGRWPTIMTTRVPADWMPYWTFSADITVSRPCLVGFTAMQEKSKRGGDWDGAVSRWTKTALLEPGKNSISGTIHDSNNYSINVKGGKVVSFEIFMYQPHEGESIYVDNIRLSTARTVTPPAKTAFRVLGTDWTVSGVQELGKKLQDRWQKPGVRTVAEVPNSLGLIDPWRDLEGEAPAEPPRVTISRACTHSLIS